MSASIHPPAGQAQSRADSLIDYPSRFPIKVMGHKAEGFIEAITAIAQRFDPGFDPELDPASLELRDSSTGKYLGMTLVITATSREQLDDLYRALTGHPMVKVVL